jgi:hypothetical protein
MYTDEFDQFVFHDAIKHCGLTARDAHAKVDHHSSWIHQAVVRLGHAESPAELCAAQREIEQDICSIEAWHDWDQQLMSAFRKRQHAALARSSKTETAKVEPAGIPAPGESPDLCVSLS